MAKKEMQLCVYCAAKMEEAIQRAGNQWPELGTCACCGKDTVVQTFRWEKQKGRT